MRQLQVNVFVPPLLFSSMMYDRTEVLNSTILPVFFDVIHMNGKGTLMFQGENSLMYRHGENSLMSILPPLLLDLYNSPGLL